MSEWKEFEKYIYQNIRRRFPANEGWTIEPKKWIKTPHTVFGFRQTDYVAYRGNERAIIDAKDKTTLSYADIEQVLDYGAAYKATHLIIYTANNTVISEGVKEYAKENEVRIIRTQWRA